MIIDAHMHLPASEADPLSKRRRLTEDMKEDGVDIGIVISDSELSSEIGSMDECAELFSDCPNVYAAAGISPYINFAEQLEKLKAYLSRGVFIAIKLYCGHEPIYIDDGALTPVFDTAAEFDVPVMFHSGWDNARYAAPERVKAAALRYNVKLVCCHCFYPDLARCFEVLKDCKNVYFDLSSVADETEKSPSLAAVLERYIPETPERFIFGWDYACCDRARHIEFIRSLRISDVHREMIFWRNAARLYNIKQQS